MKASKIPTLSSLAIAIMLLLWQTLPAQITVTPASAGKGQEASGFYYALPQNYVQVDFILEKNQRYKGPYAEFASRILGVEDYIRQDETLYTIIDAIITVYTEPDPNAYYFVEFDERSSRDIRSLVFSLQPDGIIIAADEAAGKAAEHATLIEKTFVNAPESKKFHYFAERNLYERIDTIVRKITIDTTVIRRNILQSSWVDRNPEQKARAAADQIDHIRENRYNLIRGYQEIDYGESMMYMDRKLQQLENEYLSLFMGKEVRSIEEQRFYYLPQKDKTGFQDFLSFSASSGLTEQQTRGEAVKINIKPSGNTKRIADGHKNIGNIQLSNNLYYRLPEYAEIEIHFKGKILAKTRMPISQLGVLSVAPLNPRTRVQFDPETGGIQILKRD